MIQDCVDHEGDLSRTFTKAEYREALEKIPTDVAQYYPTCVDAFRAGMRSSTITGSKPGDKANATSAWAGAERPHRRPSSDTKASDTPSVARDVPAPAGSSAAPDAAAAGPASIRSPLDLPIPLLAMGVSLALGLLLGAARGPLGAAWHRRSKD